MKATMKNEKQALPALMINRDGDVVILATSEHGERPPKFKGIVVGGDQYEIGHYSEIWAADFFSPFQGTVTLEN